MPVTARLMAILGIQTKEFESGIQRAAKGLKGFFGINAKGQFTSKTLFGAGAVAGVTMALRKLDDMVSTIDKANASFREATRSGDAFARFKWADEIAKAVPVFGEFYGLFSKLNPVARGVADEIERIAEAQKDALAAGAVWTKTAAAIDKIRDTAKQERAPKDPVQKRRAEIDDRWEEAKREYGSMRTRAMVLADDPSKERERVALYKSAAELWDKALAARNEDLALLDEEISREQKLAGIVRRNAMEQDRIHKDMEKAAMLQEDIRKSREKEADALARSIERGQGEARRREEFLNRERDAKAGERAARESGLRGALQQAISNQQALLSGTIRGAAIERGSAADREIDVRARIGKSDVQKLLKDALEIYKRQLAEQQKTTEAVNTLVAMSQG